MKKEKEKNFDTEPLIVFKIENKRNVDYKSCIHITNFDG